MNSGNIEYVNLEELSQGDYKIVSGEANITGWPVSDESGSTVGKVRDLLFDPEQNAIRYIIVDLDEAIAGADEKAVLIPIGVANLAEDKKEVILPVMHQSQFSAMPRYIIGEVTRDTEMEIRSAIGSPAALRIEEEIAELDHSEFYRHHHFDRGFVGTKDLSATEGGLQLPSESREEEAATVHELINHSDNRKADYNESNQQLSGKPEQFNVETEAGIFTVDPQENGTYRILNGEEKIGVIYAEAAEEGTQWRTMDNLEEHFVNTIGEAIHAHNS